MTNPKTVIDLHTWWLGELKKITKAVMEKEEKRKERLKQKTFAALDEYKSTDQILDAYGFGCITGREKDRLMALWEKREAMDWDDPLYEMQIRMLQDMFLDSKQVIADNELALLQNDADTD